MKNIKWKSLLIFIAIPLAVGGLAALLTMNAMDDFAALNQPPLSPPGFLFGIVWGVLYVLMGISSYLVFESGALFDDKVRALKYYFLGLGFNFLWSIFFFNLGLYLFSFLWLLALLAIIIVNALLFYRIKPISGILFIPYILWVCFAGYLNLGITLLN